jgi:hypothetical protein
MYKNSPLILTRRRTDGFLPKYKSSFRGNDIDSNRIDNRPEIEILNICIHTHSCIHMHIYIQKYTHPFICIHINIKGLGNDIVSSRIVQQPVQMYIYAYFIYTYLYTYTHTNKYA